ncbi:MAG: SPOR domain-containing protein, partial [Bacteroidetes bacterium]|nr:SPOR domain-containing protein [Bacteroidota bacterium]
KTNNEQNKTQENKTVAKTNNEQNKTQENKTVAKANNEQNKNQVVVKIEGMEVIKGNAYNANKPIPMDVKPSDGLIFRVQVGAFKTQLPNNAFGGLNPVNGETTANGYIRYTAGNFNRYENANAVKNDLRKLGYNDAFVVAYYNGKRITLSEAVVVLEKEGKNVNDNSPQTAGITENTNIPRANNALPSNQIVTNADEVKIAKELTEIKKLFYTIQVGVYSRPVRKQELANLNPIYRERLPNGNYRYTAGIYNNEEKIITDKNKVRALGINDAFVSAYMNSGRVNFEEWKKKKNQDSTIVMEPENPIIFIDATPKIQNNEQTQNAISPANNAAHSATEHTVPNVEAFKNNVVNYPEATLENGIKKGEEGICFKVQIGAYSKQVPREKADKFMAIKNWPIDNKFINGLYIYHIGNFVNAKFAKTLREEVVRLGINDAFISVWRDGKKISTTEANQLINQN